MISRVRFATAVRPVVMIGNISVWPTTSRIALSATFLIVSSGSSIWNRKSSADLMFHWITISRSTMLRSAVSIRLSSGMSVVRLFEPERDTISVKPTFIRRISFTLTSCTVSIGKGMWYFRPSVVSVWFHAPKR